MVLLSIGFATQNDAYEEAARQQIIFGHFKYHNVTVEQAREGMRHSPGIVIVMPSSGQENFLVNGQPVTVPAGLALVLSGESHNILLRGDETEDDSDDGGSIGVIEVNATVNDSYRLGDELNVPFWLSTHDSAEVADIYHDLIFSGHSMKSSTDVDDISIHLAAARIAKLLLKDGGTSQADQPGGKGVKQLDHLRRYLIANLGNKITTKDMAAHLGLTQTHFCNRAKSLLGETPVSYLRRIRLERSMELLEHTDETIESIASQVGYGDRFSFSKEFKRHYEMSPVQYRKRSGSASQDEAYLKAKALFDSNRYEQALSICERIVHKAGSTIGLDQIIYLQGRCLFALGRSEEAVSVWNGLESEDYTWQAGMQRCQLYFHNNQFSDALEQLYGLWEQADGLQHNDLIQIWTEQLSAMIMTRRPQFLQKYLDYRKEHFVTDQQSQAVALHACRCLGNTMLIIQQCLTNETRRIRALRGAGEYDQVLDMYGRQLDHEELARIYLESGQYENVLNLWPESTKYSAMALVQMGRPEEAVERYPEEAVDAYLALGQYERALDHAPSVGAQRVYALHALGRMNELRHVGRAGDWLWHFAHLYLSPETLLKVDYPQTHLFVSAATLLLALQPGKTPEDILHSINDLQRIDSNDFWIAGQGGATVLLRHVIPALLGDRELLESASAVILSKWRYYGKQKLYHDVAYLADTIDIDTWRLQPFQEDLPIREKFIRSLKDDLRDKTGEAMDGYKEFIAKSTIYDSENLFRYRFSEWRLRSLTEKPE